MIAAAVCGAALTFIVGANAQDVKQGVATVVRIHGTGSVTLDGGATWQALKLGETLQQGAVIKTDGDSTVDLVLSETAANIGSHQGGGAGLNNAGAYASGIPPTSPGFKAAAQQNVIRIFGGAQLAIDKLTYSDTGAETVSDTELDLQSGKIFGTVKKLSAMSKYEIKTPTGVAGIRGTEYSMGSDGSIICYSGSVVVAGANGTAVVVPAGSSFNPTTGAIVVLAPPGQLEAWAAQAKADAGTSDVATVAGQATVTVVTAVSVSSTTTYISP